MDENDITNLDSEFKRYLQLLRPYLGQLVEHDVIKICDAWIQRLTTCKDNEKALRNKYVFRLCYQLAKGVLHSPFLYTPPAKLQPLSDDVNSDDSSSEVEYLVVNSDEPKTKILFDFNKLTVSETDYLSQEDDKVWTVNVKDSERPENQEECGPSHKQTILCYHCPDVTEDSFGRVQSEGYECRANNLIKKLREIKMQNMLLHKELMALKEESKSNHEEFPKGYIATVDSATSPSLRENDSNSTLRSLKCQLQDIQDSRNVLIQTIKNLQEQLDHFNELKMNQIDDIEAKHKLELIKVRTDAREETKSLYEKKIEEFKQTYDSTVSKIQETADNEIKTITDSKDQIILEKIQLLQAKDTEIDKLKHQIEAQKINVQSMLSKLIEKAEDASCDSLRIKNQMLEKRLNKLEKSNIKCAKAYEAKIGQLQREKHLAECSLHLQLVRQRAQVVTELTEENQTELSTSLDKLESKYKEIVANVQATAIQRRLQDQRALENMFQAACGIEEQSQNHYSNLTRNHNQTNETENSSITRSNRVGNIVMANKSYGEDSLVAGFCLNGERMGELFERVYVPQRDNSNGEAK